MRDTPPAAVLGIDIGGANIKYALIDRNEFLDSEHTISDQILAAPSVIFPMWKLHQQLSEQLVNDLSKMPISNLIGCGITMTGELADCFFDREQGVTQIVQHVKTACDTLHLPRPLFYAVDGRFRTSIECLGHEDLLAASNWHGLAQYLASTCFPDGTLIDIGSTTTDIIPIRHGKVVTSARTDFDRLCEGSLVYVGGERSSVSMVVDSLEYQGHCCPVMREHFATTKDIRVILGLMPESDDDYDTADGKPRTLRYSTNRLARVIGRSGREITKDDSIHLARQIHQTVQARIQDGLRQVENLYGTTEKYLISGHNDDLVPFDGDSPRQYLRDVIGVQGSRNAPAVAVAGLLSKTLDTEHHDLPNGAMGLPDRGEVQ